MTGDRTHWAAGAALVALVGLASPAHPEKSARAGELIDAFLRTDFDGIARAGQREAARGLAPMLVGTDV
ncbi:MAG: hypothetical protein KJO07_10705, partial [Deltaproteobacteria bacterium]|nr:hypothetical protein [Deltaproteobacteria bacterium]